MLGDVHAVMLAVSELKLTDPRLPAIWQILQERVRLLSPFVTWQWVGALAAVPEVSSKVRVLVVTDNERVLGLLPVEHWKSNENLRVLGPAGGQWLAPDHIDVVAVPADRGRVADALVQRMMGWCSWDMLDFEGLAADGALLRALNRRRRPQLLRPPDQKVHAPYVDLLAREPALLLPSRNLRQQVRRGLRFCERTGGGLSVTEQPSDVRLLLPVLMRLHNERFGSASKVFATPERRRFHVAAAASLAEHGMARIYWLEVQSQKAALLYALKAYGHLYYYSMGFRPELGLSPGLTLLGQTLLAAAAEGLEEFDLLRGDHAFKLRFATGSRADARVRLLRATPRSLGWSSRRLADRLAPDRRTRTIADHCPSSCLCP